MVRASLAARRPQGWRARRPWSTRPPDSALAACWILRPGMCNELSQHLKVDVAQLVHPHATGTCLVPPQLGQQCLRAGRALQPVERDVGLAWAEAEVEPVALAAARVRVMRLSVADHRRAPHHRTLAGGLRSEEHTSELQSR